MKNLYGFISLVLNVAWAESLSFHFLKSMNASSMIWESVSGLGLSSSINFRGYYEKNNSYFSVDDYLITL